MHFPFSRVRSRTSTGKVLTEFHVIRIHRFSNHIKSHRWTSTHTSQETLQANPIFSLKSTRKLLIFMIDFSMRISFTEAAQKYRWLIDSCWTPNEIDIRPSAGRENKQTDKLNFRAENIKVIQPRWREMDSESISLYFGHENMLSNAPRLLIQ